MFLTYVCLCFCMSEVISSFRSLRVGSLMFALLMLFLCVNLHTMSSGKSIQLLCILPFVMFCLSAIGMMFEKNLLAVCILVDIPTHHMCTQCSTMLHVIDICFLTCIRMWQISQIQTCWRVFVGPGFVSTSSAFMRSSTSHPAGPHDWFAPKNGNRAPIAGAGEVDTICTGFARPL